MVDKVEIQVTGGRGGDGASSFHREKYIPKGPPDGGDGGKGGDIYIVADPNLSTLYDFRSKQTFVAEKGGNGGRDNRHGKNGSDLELRVPLGTEVWVLTAMPESELLGELLGADDRLLVARGGKGGRGNARFKSSSNRSPLKREAGVAGQEFSLRLDLKLIADVGLIGLPSSGKSTLLNSLSNARSLVGAYPFTTLSPQLGVVGLEASRLILADIPGLIEGASQGKGLGDDFLRHVERTRLLVHLVDPTLSTDLGHDYQVIRRELADYSEVLAQKPEIVVVNKMDMLTEQDRKDAVEKFVKDMQEDGRRVLLISAQTGEGTSALLELMVEKLEVLRSQDQPVTPKITKYNLTNLPNQRLVFKNLEKS